MKNFKETFKYITQNSAQLNAGSHIVVQDQLNAEKDGNIPHNQLSIVNQDTTSTLFIFLDNFIDQTKPDFVLFPSQQIVINAEEGYHFTTLFIKNTHVANNITAGLIKIRISTAKEV